MSQSGHTALVGALRREDAAARTVKALQAELETMQDLVKQREMDAQRTKMIIRLKEDKIARLQVHMHCLLHAAATRAHHICSEGWMHKHPPTS